jgi:uncharacterized protein with NAD-binding domain and iron-sulfur cluster
VKVLILGGGVAGITAAVYLSKCGIKTELIEANKNLGGRIAKVNLNSENFPEVDLGQHALSSVYFNLFDLLNTISASEPGFMGKEEITFIAGTKEESTLTIPKGNSNFNLLGALFRLGHLSFKEKLSLLRFFNFLKRANADNFSNITAEDLFQKFNQLSLLNKFWDKILVSIFNTPSLNINAKLLISTLNKIFFSNVTTETLLPNIPMYDLIISPALEYLKNKNFTFSVSEKATGFEINGEKIIKVITNKRIISDFDFVISTLPPEFLARLIKNIEIYELLTSFHYSPILTAYIKLKENPLKKTKYLLLDSKLDWLFNFGEYVTVVSSFAQYFQGFDKEIAKNEILMELNNFFSVFSLKNILDFVIVNKKNATIMSDNLNYGLREQINSPYSNLLLAGDWINTILPATIENAVFTAKEAAVSVCSFSPNLGIVK